MSDRNVRFVTVKNGKFIEEIMTVPINATVSDIESKFVKWVGVTNGAFWQDIHICEKCGRQLDRQGYMRDIDWKREIKYHKCSGSNNDKTQGIL